MTIYGIGVDIVETARIENSFTQLGDKFRDRIFTAAEVAYCDRMKNCSQHYAARFAAKEAVAKAFGTGFGSELEWTDVEIKRRTNGEPFVTLHGRGKATAAQRGITQIMISLSHADHYAAANAVAICGS